MFLLYVRIVCSRRRVFLLMFFVIIVFSETVLDLDYLLHKLKIIVVCYLGLCIVRILLYVIVVCSCCMLL